MDLLVALASVTAYLYSVGTALLGGTDVYFDITVVVVLVVSLGDFYEDRLKRRAAGRLTDLTEDRVSEARVRRPDGPALVDVEDVAAGDELLVRPGERIPLDGTVVEGSGTVDESLVTGESVPVRRTVGDDVVGGGVLTDGALVVEVDDGAASTLDRLVTLLWDIQSTRPGAQRLADRLAAVFVPSVVVLAVAGAGYHLLAGASLAAAFLTGLAVLVVSCPCALGLATPLAVASGISTALDRGVVVTDGSLFERATETDVVVFDKTGTLTTGRMELLEWTGEASTLRLAAAVEQFSDHPIAEAVTDAAAPAEGTVEEFERHPGRGVSATVGDERVTVGRPGLFDGVPTDLRERYGTAVDDGHLPALVGRDGRVDGLLVAGDRPRETWSDVVSALDAAGMEVVVLTGDSREASARFERHPAVAETFAGVPPEGKAAVVERLRARGPTAMVGDGSNDAPALATADLGIALESGTRLAADAADAVVTTDDLTAVPAVFELTRSARRRIRENLGWAFLYNAVAIPLAVTGLLNPLLAALAMATSSLLVVANSARPLLDASATDDATDANPVDSDATDSDATDATDGTAPDRPGDPRTAR
jgi:Cu2+-exporting ATPase